MAHPNTYVGLDIGTTKISTIIAEKEDNGDVKIVGVGVVPSEGLRRGVVVNLEKTVSSISASVEKAERMAGCDVRGVYAGIAGDHIRSINSRGVIAVSGRESEISSRDVERVVEAAKAVAIPIDREIIHVIPQGYVVDDQEGVKDPVGMSGVRLEAEVHIITGAVTSAKNMCRSIERAGMSVEDLVLEPLASAHAVLDAEEREMGVVLLDIGGGTTDIAVFHEGAIRHTCIIPLGGANVTSDIAIGLRMPIDRAEEIKIDHGCALTSIIPPEQQLVVPGVGGRGDRRISRQLLSSMIEPRVEEVFQLANREVKKHHYAEMLGAGVVITGGSSLMEGVTELAEQVFQMPVRLGVPTGLTGLAESVRDPRHSTGVGLILHGLEAELENGSITGDGKDPMDRLFDWFRGLF